ncbi:MAG: hypothetical protein GY721_10510 [Deltaproteobacteria bacterium]|nr:hypothetical protein [Deltaproteobacteria bacterium]
MLRRVGCGSSNSNATTTIAKVYCISERGINIRSRDIPRSAFPNHFFSYFTVFFFFVARRPYPS